MPASGGSRPLSCPAPPGGVSGCGTSLLAPRPWLRGLGCTQWLAGLGHCAATWCCHRAACPGGLWHMAQGSLPLSGVSSSHPGWCGLEGAPIQLGCHACPQGCPHGSGQPGTLTPGWLSEAPSAPGEGDCHCHLLRGFTSSLCPAGWGLCRSSPLPPHSPRLAASQHCSPRCLLLLLLLLSPSSCIWRRSFPGLQWRGSLSPTEPPPARGLGGFTPIPLWSLVQQLHVEGGWGGYGTQLGPQ